MGYRHQADELKKKSKEITLVSFGSVLLHLRYMCGMHGDHHGDQHADQHGDQLRRRVRADVAARRAVDDREAVSIERFLEAFDALPAPFDQEVDPIHVTGSGIVVGPRGVVLLEHKRLGIWLQPGGHIDPGETPWAAALRESREETGLEVSFVGPERLVVKGFSDEIVTYRVVVDST